MSNSPNPTWQAGQPITSPVEEMLSLDPQNLRTIEVYKLLIGSIVPRPIALVSTVSAKGIGNLAPFSFFNGVSSKPPCIMISIAPKKTGQKKDTLINIEETGQFVVNSANKWLLEPLVHCASEYPYGVDEMHKVGLTPLPALKVKPMRVKEAAIQMECELHNKMEIGSGEPGSTTLIIGKVVQFHIAKQAYQDGKVLFNQINNIGRLGGFQYGEITKIWDLPVPEVG